MHHETVLSNYISPLLQRDFLSLQYLKEIVMIVVDDLFAIGEMFRE